MRLLLPLLVVTLAGCSAPPLRSYVLTPDPSAGEAPVTAPDGRQILVEPVLLPEHLDTRDMLRLAGTNRIVARRDARWADRLSVGIRQVLIADLQARLPRDMVVGNAAPQPGFLRVGLTVTRFDLDEAGTLTLAADWTIERGDGSGGGNATPLRRRTGLVRHGIGPQDADQAAAMSGMIGELAQRIAASASQVAG